MLKVVVHVMGGVVQDVDVPPGVEVTVIDYDNDPDGQESVYVGNTESEDNP